MMVIPYEILVDGEIHELVYKISRGLPIYEDGVPCRHKGCLYHITHPCEWCGRIAGINNDQKRSQ
jgi:hypothetical protein